MIQLLKGTDRWALAQLCVEHVQPAKESYLGDVQRAERQTRGLPHAADTRSPPPLAT